MWVGPKFNDGCPQNTCVGTPPRWRQEVGSGGDRVTRVGPLGLGLVPREEGP